MEPDIAIGLIYYAMERNFPASPANQEIREALTDGDGCFGARSSRSFYDNRDCLLQRL